jgi:hypothetical protein
LNAPAKTSNDANPNTKVTLFLFVPIFPIYLRLIQI